MTQDQHTALEAQIELPPLPELPSYASDAFQPPTEVVAASIAKALMTSYARQAIAHYRQQRGEPDDAAPQPAEPDPTLPYEQALSELIDKIVPGLDSGDTLADAQTASAALSAKPVRGPSDDDLTDFMWRYADEERTIPPRLYAVAARALLDRYSTRPADRHGRHD